MSVCFGRQSAQCKDEEIKMLIPALLERGGGQLQEKSLTTMRELPPGHLPFLGFSDPDRKFSRAKILNAWTFGEMSSQIKMSQQPS